MISIQDKPPTMQVTLTLSPKQAAELLNLLDGEDYDEGLSQAEEGAYNALLEASRGQVERRGWLWVAR